MFCNIILTDLYHVCYALRFLHKNPEDPIEVPGGFWTDISPVRPQVIFLAKSTSDYDFVAICACTVIIVMYLFVVLVDDCKLTCACPLSLVYHLWIPSLWLLGEL